MKCKGCGKWLEVGRWCTECYYEYHESKEELFGGDTGIDADYCEEVEDNG